MSEDMNRKMQVFTIGTKKRKDLHFSTLYYNILLVYSILAFDLFYLRIIYLLVTLAAASSSYIYYIGRQNPDEHLIHSLIFYLTAQKTASYSKIIQFYNCPFIRVFWRWCALMCSVLLFSFLFCFLICVCKSFNSPIFTPNTKSYS